MKDIKVVDKREIGENQIETFINTDLNIKVRTIKNDDGSISINAEDSAIGFGWYQIKNNKIYPKWERMNSFISEFENSPLVGKDDYIPESLFYLLGMKASNKTAQDFQKWLAFEVIPQIRKTGGYQAQQNTIAELNNTVADLRGIITEYKKLCKITCSRKQQYIKYIKNRLGIEKANKEFEQVKARLFLILGVEKWEDIDFETSNNLIQIIDESIKVIKSERPYKQLSYFEY